MRAPFQHQQTAQPPRRGRDASGFTLLEMVIVLLIMVLLMSVAVMSFDGVAKVQQLRRPVAEFQRMTSEAVQRAGIYEQPQTIVFDARGFAMRYKTDADGRVSTEDNRAWERRVELPKEMRLSLRRFGAPKFAAAAGQRLVIAPGGLCEPLTARFELGSSWIEIELDALSGAVRDERMSIP